MKGFRTLKKVAALLCACMCMTLLQGCSGEGTTVGNGTEDQAVMGTVEDDPATENTKGRFLETEIELPEKISSVCGVAKCADDSIVLIGYDENDIGLYRECSKNQGKDWEESRLDSGSFVMAAIAGDGQAALIGYPTEEGDFSITLVSQEGTSRQLPVELPEYKKNAKTGNFLVAAAYAAGELFVVDLNRLLYEVDMESGTLSECSKGMTESVSGVISLGERLAVLTDSGVRFWNVKKEELEPEDAVLVNAIGVMENDSDTPIYSVMLTEGEKEGDFYFVNHKGIFYHREGGSTSEQLANGELISVGDESMRFSSLVRFDDEHFMVFAMDSLGKERCFSYVYDPEASPVPEKQLNVYALEDSIILQQAISLFQKNNPDVFVKKRIGMSGDNSVTAEDAIKTLNTEILAGNGPDVLVLDGLPAESYIEKGILTDISSVVEEVNQKEGLFTNITDAYQEEGALYQVPLRFFCTAAEWNGELMALAGAPGQVAEYVKNLRDGGNVLGPLPAEMFLYAFYDAYSPLWKGDGGIDGEALRSSLAAAKTLYDLDGYGENERFSYGTVRSDMMYQNQSIYGTLNTGSNWRIRGKAQISIGTICGVDRVRELYGMESSKAGSFELLSAGEERVFGGAVCLGVAASAGDNGMACAFVQSALSAEGQRQMTDYFPVNRAAYEYECSADKAYSIGGSDENGEMFGYEVSPLNETQIQKLTKMLESLNTPVWSERVVEELVISEGKRYLQGEQSLEDAVSSITRKVQLYVNE